LFRDGYIFVHVILACCFGNCFKLCLILTWGLEILYLYSLPSTFGFVL